MSNCTMRFRCCWSRHHKHFVTRQMSNMIIVIVVANVWALLCAWPPQNTIAARPVIATWNWQPNTHSHLPLPSSPKLPLFLQPILTYHSMHCMPIMMMMTSHLLTHLVISDDFRLTRHVMSSTNDWNRIPKTKIYIYILTKIMKYANANEKIYIY